MKKDLLKQLDLRKIKLAGFRLKIPAYVGIFLTIPKNKQAKFDEKYLKSENNYRNQKIGIQTEELKGKDVLNSVNCIQDIKEHSINFLNDIFNLMVKTNSKI